MTYSIFSQVAMIGFVTWPFFVSKFLVAVLQNQAYMYVRIYYAQNYAQQIKLCSLIL